MKTLIPKDFMRLAKEGESLDKAAKSECALSRIDLLVVLGVLAFLALIRLPALAHDRANSHRFVCAENLRRLAVAWQMYADDHDGKLVPNTFTAPTNWVGPIGLEGPDAQLRMITNGLLFPYSRSADFYRCPADQRRTAVRSRLFENARSYSMNAWIGEGAAGWVVGGPPFQIQTHLSLIRQPDQTFVFIEEHADSINDGAFIVDVSSTLANARFIDFPAAYHTLGANLGFADGSVRYRQWVDPRTVIITQFPSPGPQPNNPDIAWMQRVTTYRR
ncbi:MAG TPA: H-X9-DG-CTERM domain-containing protein [Verrucomicrobiae bacterium]|nr:H-X9-DG-CTERM domain-containing protein [Verrucomicrobiae bacterium]